MSQMRNQKNMNQMTVATEICANMAIENLEHAKKIKVVAKIVLCVSSTN